jgi:hypothetical protein
VSILRINLNVYRCTAQELTWTWRGVEAGVDPLMPNPNTTHTHTHARTHTHTHTHTHTTHQLRQEGREGVEGDLGGLARGLRLVRGLVAGQPLLWVCAWG